MKPKSEHDKMSIGNRIPSQRAPRWVRLLLMAGLIALCAVGFYFSNPITVEKLMNR